MPDHAPATAPGDGPDHDVIIVGAGIIGLATARELLARGRRVTLVDPDPAGGASRAAAGMLAPVAEVVWDQAPLYPLMVESGRRYRGFAAAVAAESGRDVGYLANATLVCAGDAADRRHLLELAGLQSRLGMAVQPITAGQARRLEPALGPGCVGAVSLPEDHQVDPRRLCAALLDLLGPRVRRDRVTEVLFDGERAVGVRLAGGAVLHAAEVLLAAGLGTAGIAGVPAAAAAPLRPVHGDVLRLRVPERLRPLLTRTIRGVVHGRPVYLVPRADGTVVLGATSREDDLAGVSAGGVADLLRDARRLVPAVADLEIVEMIARARPGSPDDVPVIGRLGPGLSVSGGYFRHGILLTPLGAALGADAVCGADPDPRFAAAVDPNRFTTRRNRSR
ncbi:glycine oxidase ThiO [Corynebacterium sphenisci]|uniref:glycine oxidase ThiO n=1 Tax=Corynebacterium sphenisci TaxID=191493 RepID=UPI0026E09EAF|nr:glycine oxidase ThiO [Corynebacterium sphenisci]MDO5731294.1 glycine oxidase ThiO [Corynebacterium sphenisci]